MWKGGCHPNYPFSPNWMIIIESQQKNQVCQIDYYEILTIGRYLYDIRNCKDFKHAMHKVFKKK